MNEPFLSPHWHRVAGLRPGLHTHIQVSRHRYRGVAWYVVEDDLSGRQHRFTPAVYLFVGLLDGKRTVDEVWQEVVGRLGDTAPTQDAAIQTLAQLHAADLLQTDLPPLTVDLLDRRDRQLRGALWRRVGNPMSMQIPLLDPDRFLARTIHLFRPLFGPWGLILWLMAVLPALVLAAMAWPALSSDFTDRVLASDNLFDMALVYMVTKLVHELGHGYAVKRWGGAVHELGVMILILIPMPYVDASSANAFRAKWSRVTVGAAGMMAELFLAAVAMMVWQCSEPGAVRSVAYAVMVTAGIGTVLFNANPLMRLDGYYILNDLIEMPNLTQRSAQYWRWLVERYLFGLSGREVRNIARGSERMWCVIYAPLSFAYRLMVMFGIGVFVSTHFFFIGMAIALWGLLTSLVWPLLKGIWYLLAAPALEGRRLRACTTVSLLAGLVGGGLLVLPLPLRTSAEGIVWLPDSSIVRSSTEGFITNVDLPPGAQISKNQPLLELRNSTITNDRLVLAAQIAALEARLSAQQFEDRVEADLVRDELRLKMADLDRLNDEMARLTIRAQADGVLGMPRAEDMRGRFVKRGEAVAYVTPLGNRLIRVVVAQGDVDLVRHRLVGVAVMLPGGLGPPLTARLVREVPEGSQRLPSMALGVAGGGRVATDPRDQNQTLTMQRTFQFDVELSGHEQPAAYGQRVLVRFELGSESIGFDLYRRFRQLVLSRFDV